MVSAGRYHEAEIKASIARSDELSRRRRTEDAERARTAATDSVVRETPPPYGEVPERLDSMERRLDSMERRLDNVDGRLDSVDGRLDSVDGRLDRIDRTLTAIREQMATKVELEEMRRTMATKVELESMSDGIKQMADGYQTTNERLDRVANLLKVRVVLP
jgi:chromosome segregation ATPase